MGDKTLKKRQERLKPTMTYYLGNEIQFPSLGPFSIKTNLLCHFRKESRGHRKRFIRRGVHIIPSLELIMTRLIFGFCC